MYFKHFDTLAVETRGRSQQIFLDASKNRRNASILPASRKATGGATVFPLLRSCPTMSKTTPNPSVGAYSERFSAVTTRPRHQLYSGSAPRSKSVDRLEDSLKQFLRYRDLGLVEDAGEGVAYDLAPPFTNFARTSGKPRFK